ncbi:MAG TPA: TolC family protein [Bryobacteraceae bacterium]|nr:TolC family protein [Bryobacteraceae bacterium]
MRVRKLISIFCAAGLLAPAQQQVVEKPQGFLRWYEGAAVTPVELKNSDHLHSLIRAGKLYLTVQDAIAVAIENNLDLEVDRYGPLFADWALVRAQGGGPLRGVTSGSTLVNQATSGQGVVGSQVAAGLSQSGGGPNSRGGGAIVSQIGPVTQNLDPVLQNASLFSHTTSPQPNVVQSQTTALIDSRRLVDTFMQQGLLSGGYVQVAANESYLNENAPTDIVNPSVAPVLQVYMQHNFLQGFGTGVNSRFIQVAEKNTTASSETFRSQLLNVVTSVLNLYWDLVTDLDDLAIRRRAVDQAQKFADDTQKQIELGVIPRFESFRAQAGLTNSRQLLAIAQATTAQQENLLKNALSRNGLEDPMLSAAEVVPLDRIQAPAEENLPPLRELVAKAMANRPDVALAKLNDETAAISARGTSNGVLPVLEGVASLSSSGLAGTSSPQFGITPDPRYIGNLGTAIGQIFHNDFKNQRAAVLFQATLRNHVAQGDYGIDQLQLRQGDLIERKNLNQVVLDISNQMTALRQARSRYAQAVDTRKLQEELFQKEQQLFSFGSASINDVVAAQAVLVASQETEVQTLSAYSHARISLDQVLGQTLQTNHVSVSDALKER